MPDKYHGKTKAGKWKKCWAGIRAVSNGGDEGLAEEAASEQRQEDSEGVATGPVEQRPRG